MLNIKEIAPKLTQKLSIAINDDEAVEFAEALIAELAKQNEPLYAFRRKGLDDFCTCDKRRFDELSQKPALFEVQVFYRSPFPPTAEQIANETAEAIARMLENGSFLSTESKVALAANGAAKAIRNGAWKEFKK